MSKQLQSVRGMPDILPKERVLFQQVFDAFRGVTASFGFEQIETPLVEERALFSRAIGETTDVVSKQMFAVGRSGSTDEASLRRASELRGFENEAHDWVLRPEATASVVRAYIQHGMHTWPQPVKLSYVGPMFRYERPQAGRLREFWHAGVELLGEADSSTDALVILVAWATLEALKLSAEQVVSINSVGDKKCRPKIRKQLTGYFQTHYAKLCADCHERLKKNPLRILDCKVPGCIAVAAGAPEFVDALCAECTAHFRSVLEYLDELEIPYQLSQRLVRGLDYYTRTVFEIGAVADKERQSSLLGGGRYDTLVEEYGGRSTPAVGFAIGVERVVGMLEKTKAGRALAKPQIHLVQLGEQARRTALKVARTLAAHRYRVSFAPNSAALKSQLRSADKAGARIAIIIGQREMFDQTVIVRRMDDGGQETVAQDQVLEVIKRVLQ